MRIELDCHTHSFASGHAYNTMTEMIQAAADKGLKLYALTEHAPAMPGSCGNYYSYSDLFADTKKWVDEEYAGGRVTVLTDDEIVAQIERVCKELGINMPGQQVEV